MPVMNRRGFLARAAAASFTSALIADPLRSSNLGVELYTVRNILPKDPAGVLRTIKDIGYAEIEATDYGDSTDVFKAISDSGLKPESIHMNAASLTLRRKSAAVPMFIKA
jgi:hypothetical protein